MILIFERKFEKSNLDSKNRIGNEGGTMPQIRGTHKLVLFFKNREFKVVRTMLRL